MFRDRHAVWHGSVVKEADATSFWLLSVNSVLLCTLKYIILFIKALAWFIQSIQLKLYYIII